MPIKFQTSCPLKMTSDPINRRLGVLISGRGSNLQALIDAIAGGRLTRRLRSSFPTARMPLDWIVRGRPGSRRSVSRIAPLRPATHMTAPRQELRARDVGLVCLAGFMRLVGAPLIEAFPNRILNIHPSLLPAFPGLDAQKQAIDHGVKVSGVTVHLVTAELDGGPIVVQRAVPVIAGDTADSLAARILEEEHRAYPDAGADDSRRRLARRGSPISYRLDFRRPLQRDDRDFRRAVDPDRNVDRSDPAADEHPRVVARAEPGQHRKAASATAPTPGKHDLAAMRMSREHSRHVEIGRFVRVAADRARAGSPCRARVRPRAQSRMTSASRT